MKSKRHITFVILLVGIIAAALSIGAASPEKPSFEYMVQPYVSASDLNRLGAEGWELVAISTAVANGNSTADTAYLKRLKR